MIVVTAVSDHFRGDQSPLSLVEVFFDFLLCVKEVEVVFVAHVDEGGLEAFVAVGDCAGTVDDAFDLGVAFLALGPGVAVLNWVSEGELVGKVSETYLAHEDQGLVGVVAFVKRVRDRLGLGNATLSCLGDV